MEILKHEAEICKAAGRKIECTSIVTEKMADACAELKLCELKGLNWYWTFPEVTRRLLIAMFSLFNECIGHTNWFSAMIMAAFGIFMGLIHFLPFQNFM